MKYLIFCISLIFAFSSCQKEDELTNEVDFSNPFVIEDDLNDAVQHARFEIYDKYNVAVYFNDTVGRQLIRNDINGNPYYRYETLDMPWTFFNDNDVESNVTYKYFYTGTEERQLKVLDCLATFLGDLNEKMRPAIIMAVDSVYVVRSDGEVSSILGGMASTDGEVIGRSVAYRSNFRFLLITSLADMADDATESLFVELKRDLALSKIYNFADKLDGFGDITKDNYLKGIFSYPINSDLPQVLREQGYTAALIGYGRPRIMFDVTYEDFLTAQQVIAFYPNYIEESRQLYASIVGPWGFVMPESTTNGDKMINAPATVDDDISAFVQLALMFTPEEVEHYWGNYSLVMRKYNIIRDIIENDMGIEL